MLYPVSTNTGRYNEKEKLTEGHRITKALSIRPFCGAEEEDSYSFLAAVYSSHSSLRRIELVREKLQARMKWRERRRCKTWVRFYPYS